MEIVKEPAEEPTASIATKPLQVLFNILRNPLAGFGLFVVLLVVLAALGAPFLAPYDPNAQEISARLFPPLSKSALGFHPLGTDALGRDMLSRIIYGSRVSLLVGITSVIIAGGIGVTLGLISGFKGKIFDNVIMRVADVQLAIPFLVLALTVIATLGNSLKNVIIVMGLTGWVLYARVVRAEVLSLKEREFILVANAIGVSEWKIILKHILPNVTSSIIVIATLQIARMILFEAALSFLGLGIPSDIPTWGSMVADGRNYLSNAWWISAIPGIAIFLLVMGINLVGDRIRDLLDPKLRTEN